MQIVKELRRAVADDERSQETIAKSAKIHPVTLSRFMSGTRGMTLEPVSKLASVLGLELTLVRKNVRKPNG